MRRGVLLLLLLATTLVAQERTDLGVTIIAPERLVPGTTFQWSATFTNHGPGSAAGIRADAAFNSTACFTDNDFSLAAGASRTVSCTSTVALERPPHGVTVFAGIGYGNDTNYNNNGLYLFVPYVSKPDLVVTILSPGIAVPGLPIAMELLVNSTAFAVAEDSRLTIDAPTAIAVRTSFPGCTAAGTRITCDLGDVPGPTPDNTYHRIRIPFEVVAPEGSDVRFNVTAEIVSPGGDEIPENNRHTLELRNYRTFYVTNPNDEGAGSLREAIHSANSSCAFPSSCLIAFRIENAGAFASIQPRTPLPVVSAGNVIIDGQTQHRYSGRTSELPRPLIELRGTALREGDGLAITSPCGMQLRGLAINGFPRHGVYVSHDARCDAAQGSGSGVHRIEANYIGTDPSGRVAVPNFRGIYTDGPGNTAIHVNVISGNTRAGIFIAYGAHNMISRNIIGLDASGTGPLGNGASGIYISPYSDGTDAYENHIAFNGDAGVSIGSGAEWVNVYRNAIHDNRQLAIDYGLDGPTVDAPVAAPVVTLAHYDAASDTTLIAMAPPPPSVPSMFHLHVYANDAPDPSGYGEAQRYLGEAFYNPGTKRHELAHRGDLRGKWVTAQLIQRLIFGFSTQPRPDSIGGFSNTASSEIGRAVEVQP
ncbi:MAG TPA: right-handed parallel beta-helix repeat-containing protein [Thermoanaerobaculia bacterium]|jgi:hypothetical protein